MKSIITVFIGLFTCISGTCQRDSVDVYFTGDVKGEKYRVFWGDMQRIDFTGTSSYIYHYRLPLYDEWNKRGWISALSIYRKGKFGLKYREVPITVTIDSTRRYLLIWRNRSLRNRIALDVKWIDKKPHAIHNTH